MPPDERTPSDDFNVSSANRHGVRNFFLWLAACMSFAVIATGAVLGSLALAYGSVEAAFAHLRGRQFIVLPSQIELGNVTYGERRECRLQVVNLSNEPLEVLGLRTGCGCAVLEEELPVRIPPKASRWIGLSVAIKSKQRDLQVPFTVYSGTLENNRANGSISASVTGDSEVGKDGKAALRRPM